MGHLLEAKFMHLFPIVPCTLLLTEKQSHFLLVRKVGYTSAVNKITKGKVMRCHVRAENTDLPLESMQ